MQFRSGNCQILQDCLPDGRIWKTPGGRFKAAIIACMIALLIAVGFAADWQARKTSLFNLCLTCAVVTALLVGYNTNTYDLSLLILPLTLVADECFRAIRGNKRATAIILPAVPLLVSPLWFFLWMGWQRINLIAVFLIWWLFAIRAEILRRDSSLGIEPPIPIQHA